MLLSPTPNHSIKPKNIDNVHITFTITNDKCMRLLTDMYRDQTCILNNITLLFFVFSNWCEQQVHGIPADRSKQTTRVVHNNGFNPIWEESFTYRVLCPELAIIYFRVRDHSQSGTDMPLAHGAVPFCSITTGKNSNFFLQTFKFLLITFSCSVHLYSNEYTYKMTS